ncbi:Ribosomal RNA small subunit methyltransferase C [Thalassocella blandensis]|nr:Ribosomal RNA small subunit methyltransferase C [Thalassocella blandensis]
MSNSSVLKLVLEHSKQLPPPQAADVLIALDENSLEDIAAIAHHYPAATIITNRWDIYSSCQSYNLQCTFNDFDFDALKVETGNAFDLALYRISKERTVSHHIINQLFQLTRPNGHIVFGGRKNEGIKSYFDKSKKTFSCHAQLQKNKDIYLAEFSQLQPSSAQLDDKHYSQARALDIPWVADKNITFNCTTKPGAYGWNKIDQGSEWLISTLLQQEKIQPCERFLDLGCGIGYLSLQALQHLIHHQHAPKLVVATDNNAAAITCCKLNLQSLSFPVPTQIQVLADDCASDIQQTFDLIICNPPFHQGFDTSRDLTEKFVRTTKRLLSSKGSAFFVVNSFIPIETVARTNNMNCSSLANNRQFKVIELSHG